MAYSTKHAYFGQVLEMVITIIGSHRIACVWQASVFRLSVYIRAVHLLFKCIITIKSKGYRDPAYNNYDENSTPGFVYLRITAVVNR